MTRWEDFPVTTQAASHSPLPESGWGALVAWIAGPERTLRVTDTSRSIRTVRVRTDTAEGKATKQEPITLDELAELDDDVDDYLRVAGIPPRPRGSQWFTSVDQDQLDRELDRRVDPGTPVDPRVMAELVREALAQQ